MIITRRTFILGSLGLGIQACVPETSSSDDLPFPDARYQEWEPLVTLRLEQPASPLDVLNLYGHTTQANTRCMQLQGTFVNSVDGREMGLYFVTNAGTPSIDTMLPAGTTITWYHDPNLQPPGCG